ncbi:ZYRO0C10868p [Zygosaccharomyces rouxii]|uniref:ZYRO0C10868p n=1 Tax=Zygosaccharomyces rouxii (strain ATCC 2623 / CBS 732 / NBRC 1130 / NCYC 568 / NRRL Y-229) TaxID=559307 RepID=C5DTS3_ZYGRC|nr:uncharacterized protein ZYRO0C10868g [Zygosaccharomyces rouxii]KAH9201640.1 hypothetical protein LQ764DRAFT_175584 [Zygosaccharomyces rouxii]CAR27184.1 ZYRO0C10868p [Zygosaccharomyces rouxii]
MIENPEDSEALLRAHKIDTLNVDWLINARNLNTDNPGSSETKDARSKSKSKSKSEIKDNASTDSIKERTVSNELPPDDPASPFHINANLPQQRSGEELNDNRGRRNSVMAVPSSVDSSDGSSSMGLRKTKSLSAASPDPGTRTALRRTSVPGAGSNNASPKKEKKIGFFKSLFTGKKKKGSPTSPSPSAPSSRRGTAPSSRRSSITSGTFGFPLARSSTYSAAQGEAYQHENQNHNHNHHQLLHHHDTNTNSAPLKDGSEGITRIKTQATAAEDYNGRDQRLMEFLEYYKAHGYPASAFRKNADSERMEVGAKPSGPGAHFQFGSNSSSSSSRDKTDESEYMRIGGVKYDVRGRPIPHHPRGSSLPPALKSAKESKANNTPDSRSDLNSDSESDLSAPSGSSHKFGSFLKRVTSHGGTSPPNSVSPTRSINRRQFDPSKVKEVPGLENMEPLKHVSFATNTYFNDPPQQICSKNPRKGEVEVKPNGSVVVHKLTPEERRKVLQNSSAGVVVGGSGQLRLLTRTIDGADDDLDPRKEEQMAPGKQQPGSPSSPKVDNDNAIEEGSDCEDEEEEAGHNAQHRNIRKAAAEAAAEARAKGTPSELFRSNNDEEVDVSRMAKRVTIDKPMVSRRSITSNSSLSLSSMASAETDDEILPPPRAKIPHDVVYTRCCHLREILPIPATLKQLTPGSIDPIPLLQLRNPRPSMVEVWSFSDFLSVAPVLCLSLDGVSLSVDMFKIILSSVSGKKGFEKLSLRNTPINEKGWRVLCYFVSKSRDLSALDLTMVPDIKTNVQKPSRSSLKNTIVRMESNSANRSDMNWDLLAASVAAKGGLEEVVISGAQMPAEQFENFIDVACIDTRRLGLAYNNISKEQCRSLAQWLVQSKVTGLDLGYNDLKDKLSSLNDAIWDKVNNKRERNVLRYISLNCTGLEVDAGDVSKTNEVLKLISLLCYCENLKFLDISNNPKMFPHCINTLIDCLPVCAGLTRLHLDYESLAPTSVVTLAEALPLCRRLNYLSMLGTQFDLASFKALAEAVKKSPSLITLDVDYTNMPQNIRKKVSLYTMKNVDNELNRVRSDNDGSSNGEKDPISSLQGELSKLLTEKVENEELYSVLVREYVQKVTIARNKIGTVVKDLFAIRIKGELSVEGKETLIRLCFVNASLQKRLHLLQERNQSIAKSQNNHSTSKVRPVSSSTGKSANSNTPFVSSGMVSPSGLDHTGHSALLPFGRAEVESDQEHIPQADDTIELVEKDENKNHIHGPVYGLKHNESVDKEQLGNAAKSLDTDKIKDYLMESDISEVVNVIDELHSQGYHLHDIFKKSSKNSPDLDSLSPRLAPINPGRSSSSLNSNSSDRSTNKKRDSIASKPSTDSLRAVRAEDEAIDAAYDNVLDNLQRERI